METHRNHLTISDFDIIQTIGLGSFSRVKLAKLKGNSTMPPFALKILKKSLILKHHQLPNIKSEKEILSTIKFPFIPKFFCTFQDSQFLYFLFEYICGGELFTLIRQSERFTNSQTKFYSSQILLTLEYLHSQNIIYRDLKPENLLIDRKGNIKLTDFSFSKRTERKTFTMCGTPEYMAPEVIMKSQGYSFLSDWWSFGVLLYEMSEGQSPFFDKNPIVIYQKIISGKFEFRETGDRKLRALIRGLVTESQKRIGKRGAIEVKSAEFFKKSNWEEVLSKKIKAPWVPEVENSGDTQHFLRYNEEDLYKGTLFVQNQDPELFAEF